MTENKLYAQCREEAKKIIKTKYDIPSIIRHYDELYQLTAEIYGMKLLDMTESKRVIFSPFINQWEQFETMQPIGSTQDLHDHFVREFNVSLTNEGNNGKQ